MRQQLHQLLKVLFFLPALAILPHFAAAQDLTVQSGPPWNPENLITNVFLGDGVEVLGVTFNGESTAVGYFADGDEDIGINRGIVMTTGAATGAGGVNNPGANQASVNNGSGTQNNDLNTIASPFSTNDVAEYIITFVPISDTLRFNYSFASEEYPEFACSNYNDVFGFFISGPGINGPYENNAENIAIIPDTDLPVTINNVNSGMVGASGTIGNCTPPNGSLAYSEFYVNNNGSNSLPIYDGLTTVLTAEAVVMPCSTYTIRLAIADVSDGIYDSGVFLEAKSFGTGTLEVDVATISLDGTIAEGCTEGVLSFSTARPVEADLPIDYTILGSAENGVDYEFIPPDLFIPAGDSVVSVPIIAFDDGLVEGTEFILVDVQRDVCNRDTFRIPISDNLLVPPELGPDTTICPGDTVLLDGTLDIDLPPPPSFTNNNTLIIEPANTEIYSDIDVFGVQPFTLGPESILSVCIDNLEHNWVDDLQIFLISPGGQVLELVTDIGNSGDDFIGTCFTPEATIRITDLTAADMPFTGEWAPEGVWSDLWDGENPTNGTWQLLLRDKFTPDVGILTSWTITFNSVYQVDYAWTPSAGLSCDDCPDPIATPDTTTTYILEATDSYGCSVYDTITINVLDQLDAPLISCDNVTGNSITVVWDDIPGSFGYEVNVNNMGWEPANSGGSSHTISGLDYNEEVTIEVRGIGDCPGAIATITCMTLDCEAPQATLNTTAVSCADESDGSLIVNANGGLPPYTFEISDGSPSNTTGEFFNLPAGEYTLTLTDDANCGQTISFTIPEPEPLEVEPVSLSPLSCNGADDGSATIIISGGNGPYSFLWDNGQQDSIATNLDGGLTLIQVTDAQGCESTVEINIEEPALLELSFTGQDVSCGGASDGSLSTAITGGTEPYTYTWSTNAGNTSEPDLTDLAGDEYFLTITDANGCIIDTSYVINEDPPLSLSFSVQNASCNDASDGSVLADVQGGTGTGTYTYSWLDLSNGINPNFEEQLDDQSSGMYELVVTDANGCSIIDTATIDAPQPLSAELTSTPPNCVGVADGQASLEVTGGTPPYNYIWSDIGLDDESRDDLAETPYQVIIIDDNGCELIVDIDLEDPSPIELQTDQTEVSCDGGDDGTATVTASGGSGGYTYEWEDGQTDATATGLPQGTYNVEVTDMNGCVATTSIEVSSNTPIELSIDGNDPLCTGTATGTGSVTPSGGTPPYSYNWSSGETNATASQLIAGSNSVTVTDANDCTAIIQLSLNDPQALSTSTTSSTVGCFGSPDGEVSVNVNGGQPPYSYNWDNGQTTATATGLAQGVYNVTVTDANGCTIEDNAEVMTPPEIELSISGTDIDCNGNTNGNIQLEVTGGEPPYTYNWNTSIPSIPNPQNLGAGSYQVTVEDSNGCTETISIDLSQPAALQASSRNQLISCADSADGAIDLVVSGGQGPYEYFWSNGANTQDLENLPEGDYNVLVVDANGCQLNYEVSLSAPNPLVVSFDIQDVECYGDSDGMITANVSGGVNPITVDWAAGSSNRTIEGLAAGTYAIQISDANGCILETEAIVEQPDAPIGAQLTPVDVSCFGESDGIISVEAAGGTPFYTYSLDNEIFSGSSNLIGLSPGTYNVYIQDANGCIFLSDPVSIAEPEPTEVSLGSDFSIPYGDTAMLNAITRGTNGTVFYDWTPIDTSCFNCPELAVFLDYQTSYRVRITDENGCTDEDVVTVTVEKDFRVDVPTGFTPNGDNVNDRLLVHGPSGTIVRSFRVFDRWGELIYEDTDFDVNDPNRGWNGQFRDEDASSGVYIWTVSVEYEDGFEEQLKGHTTLIR